MPRPKGSKNKKTLAKAAIKSNEIAEQLAKLNADKAGLETEQETITAVIAEENEKLKAVKKNIKTIEKQIVKLEAKQAAEAAKAEAEAKGQELQDKIAELLAAGKSYDEILNMLK